MEFGEEKVYTNLICILYSTFSIDLHSQEFFLKLDHCKKNMTTRYSIYLSHFSF